jgi:hypothetical protein
MKTKKLLIVTILLLLVAPAFSQTAPADNDGSFHQGTNVISGGVGIGGVYSYWSAGYSETPNFVLTYENGTFPKVGPGYISLGGLVSYKGISYNYIDPGTGYSYSQKWNYWIIGLRSAYHYNFFSSQKCDPYLGLMLGYYDLSYKFASNDPYYGHPGDPYYYASTESYASYLGISAYLGFRYYITTNVGLWAELGYGYTTLAAGVQCKF